MVLKAIFGVLLSTVAFLFLPSEGERKFAPFDNYADVTKNFDVMDLLTLKYKVSSLNSAGVANSNKSHRVTASRGSSGSVSAIEQSVIVEVSHDGIESRVMSPKYESYNFDETVVAKVELQQPKEISEDAKFVLDYWGIEVERVRVNVHEGISRLPFPNPQSDSQRKFNNDLKNGYYEKYYSKPQFGNTVRVKTIRPDSLFKRFGVREGDFLKHYDDAQRPNHFVTSPDRLKAIAEKALVYNKNTVNGRTYPLKLHISRNRYHDEILEIDTAIPVDKLRSDAVVQALIKEDLERKREEYDRSFHWLLATSFDAPENQQSLSKSENKIVGELFLEYHRISDYARDLSPINCQKTVRSSFYVSSSFTICEQKTKPALAKIFEKNKQIKIDRSKFRAVCEKQLKASFCKCAADEINGHFSRKQYELFMKSPRAFASYFASRVEKTEKFINYDRNVILTRARTEYGSVDGVKVYRVDVADGMLIGKCRF